MASSRALRCPTIGLQSVVSMIYCRFDAWRLACIDRNLSDAVRTDRELINPSQSHSVAQVKDWMYTNTFFLCKKERKN